MQLLLQKKFYQNDVIPLLRLAIPLILTGFVESSVGFFSTIFLARLGQNELAAGALVSWLFVTLMVVLWGTLTAVSVSVAQKYGAKDTLAIANVVRDGLLLSLILVPPTFLLLWYMAPLFLLLGQSPAVVVLAQSYLHGLAWGLLPDFVLLVLLQFLVGLGHVRVSMVFTLLLVPTAILCNYALIFGKFGVPALGMAGIGWGTSLSYWITAVLLVVYLGFNKTYRPYFQSILSFRAPFYLWELTQIGLPMGTMYCIEVGFFLALTLLMGLIGNQELAANQIVLQFLGQLVAVVFAIAQAVTVRMGHMLGAKDAYSAQQANYAGVFIALSFMTITSLCYWFIPTQLIKIDLNVHDPINAGVVTFAIQFFAIGAIFQLLEAARITMFGALRALKDTNYTLLTSIISFWLIALPVGYLLSQSRLGASGLWWGMVLGACCSVVMLYYRFRSRMARVIARSSLSIL